MQDLLQGENSIYFTRIMTAFVLSFVLLAIVSQVIGEERKAKWFKKRTRYTVFTRRSVIGECMHFGRPCTWEGLAVFLGTFGSIFSFGYWYIFR